MRDRSAGTLLVLCSLTFGCGEGPSADATDAWLASVDATRDAATSDASEASADASADAAMADASEVSADASMDMVDAATFSCASMPDGTACGAGRLCVDGACVVSECGDGVVDATSGEACDDGNRDAADGCESTCVWSCIRDEECTPVDACEGPPRCDATHVCVSGAPLACDDSDPCTLEGCDPVTACSTQALDADGDGYVVVAPPVGCALPSGDCDDANNQIFPGAVERCEEGVAVDNNCNGDATDGPRPRAWFVDCDGDGVAAPGAGASPSCGPPSPPDRCVGRGWTDVAPVGAGDCNDMNADVFPGQTESFGVPTSTGSFDYDCDGMAATSDVCGGVCSINYSSGTCNMSRPTRCTGACGATGRVLSYCSDAVRCREMYFSFQITCR